MSTAPADTTASTDDARRALAELRDDLRRLVDEIQRVIVGQDEVIAGVVTCLVAGGHGLLEGVPGLGKTLLVRTLAEAVRLSFARIQFTPDLMPADIVGTQVLVTDEADRRALTYQPGPIFANIVLADEVNRATPKTQSALLEAMAEGTVTAGGETRPLPDPFLVLATQNPLEMEGTYPLPEAQLDRFLLHIQVPFPGEDDLVAILDRTTGEAAATVRPVLDADRIRAMRSWIRSLPVAPSVTRYVARLLRNTHPSPGGREPRPPMVERYVRFGASPRGAQALLLAARVHCVLDGRLSPGADDVKAVAHGALRHRIILNFEGEAEGIAVDACIDEILDHVAMDDS